MTTVADLIRVLAELDQQCMTERPSSWALGAEMVRQLCQIADCDGRRKWLGDWDTIDLKPCFSKRAPSKLHQPILDAIREEMDAIAKPKAKTGGEGPPCG
jgi:hypothetical protein